MSVRLIATPERAIAGAVVLGVAIAVVAHEMRATGAGAIGVGVWVLCVAAFAFYLRGADARLVRDLRVARTGSDVQRRHALRGRRPLFPLALFALPPIGEPLLLVLLVYVVARALRGLASTRLGYVAVLLADGAPSDEAARALGWRLPRVRRSAVAELRAVVEADVRRARGTEEALGDAIRALCAMPPLAHPECERYRIHVLTKAILEQADGGTARDLAETLSESADDEVRVYAVWLRTWFELDHLPEPTEGDVRRALLLARTHGAEDLAARLAARLAESAGPPPGAVAPDGPHG